MADPRRRDGEWWGSRSLGSIALDWLFRIGAVGIRRRGNFVKEFDLLERIVPAEVLARPTPTADEAQRELLVRSAQALGMGTATDLIDYYRLPIREGRARLRELVEAGLARNGGGGGMDRTRLPEPRGPASTVGGHPDGAVAVRSGRVEPGSGGPAVGLRLPHRDLRARSQAGSTATTCCRCCTASDWWPASTSRPTGPAEPCECWARSPEPDVDHGALAERLRPHLQELARFVGVDGVSYGDRGDLIAALRAVRGASGG